MGRKYDEMKADGVCYYDMLDELFGENEEMMKAFEGAVSGEIGIDEWNHDAGWFATHFYSTAEHLYENIFEYEDDEEGFKELWDIAVAEVEILKKYGYDGIFAEEMLKKIKCKVA